MSLDKIVGIGLVIREKEKVLHTRLLLFFHLKTDYSTLASLLELLRSHIGLLFFASGKAFYVVGVFWVLQAELGQIPNNQINNQIKYNILSI